MGAINFNWAMIEAAHGGHVEIVKLCREWGAMMFNWAMSSGAKGGHVKIMELCKEWGARDFGLCQVELRAVMSRS